jgi:hypothetical protein
MCQKLQFLVKTSMHFACILHELHANDIQHLRTSSLWQLFKTIHDGTYMSNFKPGHTPMKGITTFKSVSLLHSSK